VSYKEGGDEKDEKHLNARLYQASTVVFAKQAVGLSDKWNFEFAPNADLGTPKAHAEYEIIGDEKIKDVEVFKIRLTYAEDGAGPENISGKGTVWVEKSSGDPIRTEYNVEGLPFGPDEAHAVATGTLVEERVEGGPLAAAGKAADGPVAKKEKTIDDQV